MVTMGGTGAVGLKVSLGPVVPGVKLGSEAQRVSPEPAEGAARVSAGWVSASSGATARARP